MAGQTAGSERHYQIPKFPLITPSASPWMDRALALAERGAGFVSTNPMVGALLVTPSGEVLGEGWHGRYGGPHAEAWAIRDAGRHGFADRLEQCTLVVTLEPCSHHGKTPPCVDAILEHRIPRVIAAMEDPNPKVAGSGLRRLRELGIEVGIGIGAQRAWRLNEAYVKHVTTGQPLVTVKIAQTLDGRVATRTGESRWVSGPESRAAVHRMRAEADAVLVGAGTAQADDPALTVRHNWPGRPPGDTRQPLRVVLDRRGELAPTLKLFSDPFGDSTVAVVGPEAQPAYAADLQRRGGTILRVPSPGGHLDLRQVMVELGRGPAGRRPVQSLLVEAGPRLATALLNADLTDRLFVFCAPRVLGHGLHAVGDLGLVRMADALAFADHSWERFGPDMLFRGYRRAVPEGAATR